MSEATVRRYQSKSDPSVIVQAEQFDPNKGPWPDCVIPWPDAGESGPRPKDMSWGCVNTPSRRIHVFAGDYIVLDREGKPYPVRPAVFEEEYRPVIVINTNPDGYPAIPELSAEEELKQLVRGWRNFLRSTALQGAEKNVVYDADWVELHLRLEIKSKYLLNEG